MQHSCLTHATLNGMKVGRRRMISSPLGAAIAKA